MESPAHEQGLPQPANPRCVVTGLKSARDQDGEAYSRDSLHGENRFLVVGLSLRSFGHGLAARNRHPPQPVVPDWIFVSTSYIPPVGKTCFGSVGPSWKGAALGEGALLGKCSFANPVGARAIRRTPSVRPRHAPPTAGFTTLGPAGAEGWMIDLRDLRGYLDAIGREKSAEAIRAAEIAEAQAEADTREAQAEARRRAEVREAAASIKVAEAQNELRVRQTELDREGETAEKIARVRAQEAEVEAEKVLEMKRVEREEQRLRADVIEPAKAEKQAAFARAEAEAAPILERGKAQVEVLRRLYAEVQTGGDAAFAVFMAEKLPELLEIAVGAVEGVDIDRVVVMDGGQGEGVSNALNQRVRGAYGTMEGLASVLGLDIQEVLQRAVGSGDEDGGQGAAKLPPA